MRKTFVWITLGCCLMAVALVAWAQGTRKPGLWEMTATMTWQKTPLPPGVTMPAGMASPFAATTHTSQMCITQAMIDKYGAPVPPGQGDCKVTNIVMKPTGMTADMVCTGKMNATATIVTTWSDANSSKSNVHFTGSMQMGPNATPIEFTIESLSVYKGADCGSVKPLPMPSDK